jgi:hypothetical protein
MLAGQDSSRNARVAGATHQPDDKPITKLNAQPSSTARREPPGRARAPNQGTRAIHARTLRSQGGQAAATRRPLSAVSP